MIKKSLLCTLCAVLLLTTACGQAEVTQETLPEVVVTTVKMESVSNQDELSGTLQPVEEVYAAFEVPGRIEKLIKKEGDLIKAGDVLATLDARDYVYQAARATAGTLQAAATREQADKGARPQEIQQAKALADKATAAWKKSSDDFKRIESLYKEGVVSQADYDGAKTALAVATSDKTSAQMAYAMAKEGPRSEVKKMSQAGYDAALSSEEQAKLAVEKTSLKSTISGTVLSKIGVAGQLTAAGSPIYRVGNIDTLKMIVPVPDHSIADWKKGDQLNVFLYDQTRIGIVSNVYPAVSLSTGTIGVEVQIDNKDHGWFAGQVVTCAHAGKSMQAIYVPIEAVISTGTGQPYVFVLQKDKVKKMVVTTGGISGNRVEILTGLSPNDQVVVTGASKLFDGMAVKAAGGGQK